MAFIPSNALLILLNLSFISVKVVFGNGSDVKSAIEQPKFANNTHLAVHGYVYCKACEHVGVDTLVDATPLPGALVRLQCKDNVSSLVQETNTNKDGYFSIRTKQTLTTIQFENCKVSLVSSAKDTCNIVTNIHGGLNGAFLKFSHKVNLPADKKSVPKFEVFAVGPFAFEASSMETCSPEFSSILSSNCDPNCLFICNGCCHC